MTTATLIARYIEPRSIYDARLNDTQVRDRHCARSRYGGLADMSDEANLPRDVSDEGAHSFLRGLLRENCPYPPNWGVRRSCLAGVKRLWRDCSAALR